MYPLLGRLALLFVAYLLVFATPSSSSWPRQQVTSGEMPIKPIKPRNLIQSAPYTIEANNDAQTGNIVFRLSQQQNGDLNKTTDQKQYEQKPLAFASPNGTLMINSGNDFNLQNLMDVLNNNNYTSDVKFGENLDGGGLINITVSKLNSDIASPTDRIILEDLIMAVNSAERYSLLNGSSVMTDNHRQETRTPLRSRPNSIRIITPPPIRSAIEVVAENYTMRKIADEANIFAIKLLNQLNIEKLGNLNLIQTPFAVYQGLTLLLSGAMGDTARELDRVLLGSSSIYENSRLTHDQDKDRLLASLGDVVRQLHRSSTNHLRSLDSGNNIIEPMNANSIASQSSEQHLIVANNLLFSPSAYEISNEFKNSINSYYNNTVLTKIEIGSTESIQVVNNWIREATLGIVPFIFNKRNTFDEFHVMSLLSTSWLAQEWQDNFDKISSPLKSNIRLKGPKGKSTNVFPFNRNANLLEFVDDQRRSHFVEYMKSERTKNIHHYRSMMGNTLVDVVAVPFYNSNHRLILITPLGSNSPNTTQQLPDALSNQNTNLSSNLINNQDSVTNSNISESISPDYSLLSKFIATIATSPARSMQSLWNIIAPEIITKQTLQNIQAAKQRNITIDEHTFEATMPPLVQLSMPLIRVEADSSISAALNHIGIVNSFDPSQGNFIGINGHPFNYNKLHLSNVVSKTTFNLNEKGINYDKTIKSLENMRILPPIERKNQEDRSKDTDSTNRMGLVDEIVLNKPFLYLLCDIRTKLILYTGVMRNPMQDEM